MDHVLVMCDKYAILRKGKEGRGVDVLGELKALTDMRPENGFEASKKQMESYLERYGRRLLLDVEKCPFHLSERGLPNEVLEPFGYCEHYSGRTEYPYQVNRLNRNEDNDTYVVAIKSVLRENRTGADAGAYSLYELLRSVAYVSRLAILSTGRGAHGLDIEVEEHYSSVAVTFKELPIRLCHHVRNNELLSGVLTTDYKSAYRGEAHGCITLDMLNASATVEYDTDSVSKITSCERTAASLLLVHMARENFLGSNEFAVDPKTGGIVSQKSNNLILAVLQYAADGNVRPCAHCGRPVFGNAKFCRGSGCRARYMERARAVVVHSDMCLEDARERFPVVKLGTLEKWFSEREER